MKNKIETFNKTNLNYLRKVIMDNLSTPRIDGVDIEDMGLTAELGGARYSSDHVEFKLNITIGGKTKMEQDLDLELSYHSNIDKDKVAEYHGSRYKPIGYKRANRTYPFIVKNLDNNKDYKFPVGLVKNLFSKEDNIIRGAFNNG